MTTSISSPTHPIFLLLLITLPSILCDETVKTIPVFRKFNDKVELSCGIDKMDRNIKVIWKRGDEEFLIKVDQDGTQKNSNFDTSLYDLVPINSALKITKVTDDTSSTFTCTKWVKKKMSELKYMVTAYEPATCQFPENDLEEGKTYLFETKIVFSGTAPQSKWTIGGEERKGKDDSDISYDRRLLDYEAKSEDDGKDITLTYFLVGNEEVCTRKLSILHPPKTIQIRSNEPSEKGGEITCSSNGNPKANLKLKSDQKTLKEGVGKVVYTIPEDYEMDSLNLTCHAKNKYSEGEGISTKNTVYIIAKAAVKGSATCGLYSVVGLMGIIIITTLLHGNH